MHLSHHALPFLSFAGAALAASPADPQPTIYEHKFQRQLKAPEGAPVVRQVIASVAPNGSPFYSMYQGPAPAAPTSDPIAALPRIHPRNEDANPPKILPSQQQGILQNQTFADLFLQPNVTGTQYLGISQQRPILKYLPHINSNITGIDPASFPNQTTPAVSTDYPLWNGTGMLPCPDASDLVDLPHTPYFYRDNGKGGYLDGEQLFLFADTGVNLEDENLDFVSFVWSSVVTDKGRNAINGGAPVIQDWPGGYDNAGAQIRGSIPMTTAEYVYTEQYQSGGKRYALWTQASITPLDSSRALAWAGIVYINTAADALYTTAGNTLLTVHMDQNAGPIQTRVTQELFAPDDLQYGTLGAIRSWGPSGPGGMDGWVYAYAGVLQGFGGGLALSRVAPENAGIKSEYEYYNNNTKVWSKTMPDKSDYGFFAEAPYANCDIFYSPRHLTWIIVFQSPFADNSYYWQYLKVPLPWGVKPVYGGGVWEDLASAIYQYEWSKPELLYTAPAPPDGRFIYGGGVNMGYFGDDDIINGGNKMLVHWDEPLDPNKDWRQYNLKSVVITWT